MSNLRMLIVVPRDTADINQMVSVVASSNYTNLHKESRVRFKVGVPAMFWSLRRTYSHNVKDIDVHVGCGAEYIAVNELARQLSMT